MNKSENRWFNTPLFLSILGGAVLGLGWYPYTTFFTFIGFVPLFYSFEKIIQSNSSRKTLKIIASSYLFFIFWNIVAYWWLWNASGWATLAAWGMNSLLMLLPVAIYLFIRKRTTDQYGYWVFLLAWLAFEYLHLHWDFSWIWLNLGNAFAYTPSLVQWYEYTGTFGGSLWILVVNILLFSIILKKKKQLFSLSVLIVIPIAFSLFTYYNYEEKGTPIEVVVVQPNLDCYKEKFNYNSKTGERNQLTHVPYPNQIERLISLTKKEVTDSTSFILWPETALHKHVNEDAIAMDPNIQLVDKQTSPIPLITGITSYQLYGNAPKTVTSRYQESMGYYDIFNAALYINEKGEKEVYHKSKLVIGAEKVPFPIIFKPLLLNFGGSSGGLGTQRERDVFNNSKGVGMAPVICYESVYGEFVGEYVKKGANALAIITNDGWWGETPGYKQHLAFASLRAVETRKSIARSANTGISCFINQKGDGIKKTKYDEQAALREVIFQNDHVTFYTKHGDYIGRISSFITIALFLGVLVKSLIFRKRKQ